MDPQRRRRRSTEAITLLLPRLVQFIAESSTVFVNVDSRSDAFDPLLLWLHDHPYAARCRRLDASLGEIRNQDGKLIFTPSVGDHLFWQSGRPVWLSRSRETAKSSIGSEKIETIRLTALGRNRNFLRRIIEDAVAHYGGTDNNEMSLYAVDQYFEWVHFIGLMAAFHKLCPLLRPPP